VRNGHAESRALVIGAGRDEVGPEESTKDRGETTDEVGRLAPVREEFFGSAAGLSHSVSSGSLHRAATHARPVGLTLPQRRRLRLPPTRRGRRAQTTLSSTDVPFLTRSGRTNLLVRGNVRTSAQCTENTARQERSAPPGPVLAHRFTQMSRSTHRAITCNLHSSCLTGRRHEPLGSTTPRKSSAFNRSG
jgi:hypothetical protein